MSHEDESDYDSTMATTTRLETDFEKSFSALFDNLICVQILDSSFCFDDSFDNGIVRHFDVRTVFMPWAWKKIEEYAEESQASRLHNKVCPGIVFFIFRVVSHMDDSCRIMNESCHTCLTDWLSDGSISGRVKVCFCIIIHFSVCVDS